MSDFRPIYCFYDAKFLDWDEALRRAALNRPRGETGTIICLPRGGRLRPPKAQNDTPAKKRRKGDDRQEV